MLGFKRLSLSFNISFVKLFVFTKMYQYSSLYFTCLFRTLSREPEAMLRKMSLKNEKSTANVEVILNKVLTKHAFHQKRIHEG